MASTACKIFLAASALVIAAPILYGANLFVSEFPGPGAIGVYNPSGTQIALISSALFQGPEGLAFDSAGNLYVADLSGNIYKITPAGIISTFASGFSAPQGLAFDASGNLYVAAGNFIYKITPAGMQSTFASGFRIPIGLAFDSSGNLYVADEFANTITRITPAGTPTTIVSSGLNQPQGLAFDSSGNLYEADYGSGGNGIIQEFTSMGALVKVISLLPFTFVTPEGLAFDSAGNLYVPDNRTPGNIYEITPADAVSIFASGLDDPQFLAFSPPALTQDASFQIRYAANLNLGESYIDITNTGANGDSLLGPGFGATQAGNICVNVYAFDPSEEMIACCSCLVTPDQTVSLGVNADLTVKTLTGVPETSVTIKLLASLNTTTPLGGAPGVYGCTNSAATVVTGTAASGTNTVAPFGMAAWGTTLHTGATAGSSSVTTETPFTPATLSSGAPGSNNELQSLTGRCAAIIGNASGYGICTSCQAGALGGKKL